MRFSIVTVSFNQAPFLESAILSVLGQNYPDIEYILVDPGSTDGSRAIIERYRDRIARIVYEPDTGAADGLNHGFAVASGDIFGFLNADDILLPGALESVARQFSLWPDADIVMGHMRVLDAKGTRLRDSYSDAWDARAFAYGACVVCQPSAFFRAVLYRKVGGFNARNPASWDAELFLAMFQAGGQPVLADDFFSALRLHPSSMTGMAGRREDKRSFSHAAFEQVMGRPWRRSDHLVRILYLVRKYLREPRSAIQRLLHGPVAGRYRRTSG